MHTNQNIHRPRDNHGVDPNKEEKEERVPLEYDDSGLLSEIEFIDQLCASARTLLEDGTKNGSADLKVIMEASTSLQHANVRWCLMFGTMCYQSGETAAALAVRYLWQAVVSLQLNDSCVTLLLRIGSKTAGVVQENEMEMRRLLSFLDPNTLPHHLLSALEMRGVKFGEAATQADFVLPADDIPLSDDAVDDATKSPEDPFAYLVDFEWKALEAETGPEADVPEYTDDDAAPLPTIDEFTADKPTSSSERRTKKPQTLYGPSIDVSEYLRASDHTPTSLIGNHVPPDTPGRDTSGRGNENQFQSPDPTGPPDIDGRQQSPSTEPNQPTAESVNKTLINKGTNKKTTTLGTTSSGRRVKAAISQRQLDELLEKAQTGSMYDQQERADASGVSAACLSGYKPDADAGKIQNWTYTRLARAPGLTTTVQRVIDECQAAVARLAANTGRPHRFEFLIAIDNSTSMRIHKNKVYQLLTVVMESLRRMECPFAIARFGKPKIEQRMVLKELDEGFNNAKAQQILESFTFNEGTRPADAMEPLIKKVWTDREEKRKSDLDKAVDSDTVHRMMLMLTDGLTNQTHANDYHEPCEREKIDFGLTVIRSTKENITLVEEFDKVGLAVAVQHVFHADHLVTTVAQSIITRIKKKCSSGAPIPRSSSTTTHAPYVVKSDIIADVPKDHLHWRPLAAFKEISLQEAREQGSGGDVVDLWRRSPGNQLVPSSADKEAGRMSDEASDVLNERCEAVREAKTHILLNPDLIGPLRDAEAAYLEMVSSLSWVDSIVDVFESGLFPVNKFTRRKGDSRGTALYLPGLIKAVTSQ